MTQCWKTSVVRQLAYVKVNTPCYDIWHEHVQWNLEIRDTQGTVKNCPEFWGGLISQVHFYVLNRPREWSGRPHNSQVVPISQVALKTRFTVLLYTLYHHGLYMSASWQKHLILIFQASFKISSKYASGDRQNILGIFILCLQNRHRCQQNVR